MSLYPPSAGWNEAVEKLSDSFFWFARSIENAADAFEDLRTRYDIENDKGNDTWPELLDADIPRQT